MSQLITNPQRCLLIIIIISLRNSDVSLAKALVLEVSRNVDDCLPGETNQRLFKGLLALKFCIK